MSEQPPERWLDDPDLDADLRAGLEGVRERTADYDASAGLARFEASVSGAATAAAGKAATSTLWWVLAAVVATAAVAAWMWAGSDAPAEVHAESVPHSAAPPPPVQPDPVPPVPGSPPVPEPPPAAAAPSLDAGPPPAVEPPRRRRPTPKASPPPADTLEAEMKATNAAKRALATDPARALRLVRDADAAFAGGVFGPERAGIAVLALLGSGDVSQARRKAAAYLRKHPKGAYAGRIRRAFPDLEG